MLRIPNGVIVSGGGAGSGGREVGAFVSISKARCRISATVK